MLQSLLYNNSCFIKSFKFKSILGSVFLFLFALEANSQPIINSFSPLNGPVGTTVNIVGSNFSADTSSNVVFFGATRANVLNASPTNLTVVVPIGATYQPISVVNTLTNLIGNSVLPFEVTYNNGIGQLIATSSFSPKVDFTTGANPSGIVAVADIDGDGKPDMVVVNRSTNTFSILKNTSSSLTIGKTSFASKVDFATDSTPSFVTIGDLDGDGKQDIVIVNMFTNKISVYRNTSTIGTINAASFAAKVNFIADTISMPTSVAIGDLDGDGKPELVVTNSFSNSISILKNTAHVGNIDSTSFAPSIDFTTGLGPVSVAISDINGDGKPDLIVSDFDAKTISVLKNISTSGSITKTSFAAKVDFKVGTCPNALTTGDLNGDGKPDIIVLNQANSTISILQNVSKLGVIDSTSLSSQIVLPSNGSSPYFVSVGNVDSDSLPDIVVANLISNNISIIKNVHSSGNLSASSFSSGVNIPTGYFPVSVAIADFNGDDKPDLAVPNYGANTISVFQNLSANILPVSFVSFTGNYNSGEAFLNWKTTAQLNIDNYTIERSYNGVDFSNVGKVNAQFSDDSYAFIDVLPPTNYASTVYYRLVAIENNGNKTLSSTVALNIIQPNNFIVYPNPAHDVIYVKANNERMGNAIWLITDVNGHAVLSNRLSNKQIQQIGIGTLAKGIYNVTIFTASGKLTQQIIRE